MKHGRYKVKKFNIIIGLKNATRKITRRGNSFFVDFKLQSEINKVEIRKKKNQERKQPKNKKGWTRSE